MTYWLLITVIVLIVFFLLKFKELRHRVVHFVIILLVLFLILSTANIYLNNDVDLTSFDGIVHAGKLYFSWLGAIAKNVGKISSYAVKQDWDINITNVSGES